MTSPEDREASIAALRDRVVARVMELGGDEALAHDVGSFVAAAARGRLGEVASDPGLWQRLEDFGASLAVHRLRKHRRRLSPELIEVIAGAESQGVAEADVLAALNAVPARERAVLEMVYVDGYDLDAAAEFFDLSQSGAQRVLARARRQLRRVYRAQRGGTAIGVLVDAGRRMRAVLVRVPGHWAESLVGWSLDPIRAAVATTAGVSAAVLAVVAINADPPSRRPELPARGASPVVIERGDGGMVMSPPSAPTAPLATRASEQAPSSRAAPDAPLTVEQRVERRPSGTQTSYRAEVPAPVRPPPERGDDDEEPSRSVLAVFFDCPPPESRTFDEGVICPVVAS